MPYHFQSAVSSNNDSRSDGISAHSANSVDINVPFLNHLNIMLYRV